MKQGSTIALSLAAAFLLVTITTSHAQGTRQKWVASWTGSAQGPYPSGNPVAQPELRFAFPAPADGATDMSFRMIVKPDLWGSRWRIRFTNALGTTPLTVDGVYLGVQLSGGNIMPGTNRAVMF